MNIAQNPQIAIILVNLGTPDEPTPSAVRRYLQEFLSDPRVIEIPQFLWKIILNLFVIPLRCKRVAHAYASIWGKIGDDNDSPIRSVLNEQVKQLQNKLGDNIDGLPVSVHSAMTYGNPNIRNVLTELTQQGIEHLIILPLFPQYSATSAGAVYDAITKWSLTQRNLPHISIIKDYFAHPTYIQALAESIQRFQTQHGKPEKLMFSFHGIPQPYADKGDPYPERCRYTAEQVAKALNLKDDEWLTSFQSRFGKQEWVKPYTDETLDKWGKTGVQSVQVISPAFSADCLETLEELNIENRDNFINAGGKEYHYIPALNTDERHIEMMKELVLPLAQAWVKIIKSNH